MVSERFKAFFSKKKKGEEEDISHELRDILENLEEARSEQLVMASIPKEKKDTENVPITPEEDELETVEEKLEERKNLERKEGETKDIKTAEKREILAEVVVEEHINGKGKKEEKREVVMQKEDSKTSEKQEIAKEIEYSYHRSISNLFEVFKTEFLEYLVNKSMVDRKTRELLFNSLEKLEKKDLIEIIRIMYRILDEKIGVSEEVKERISETSEEKEKKTVESLEEKEKQKEKASEGQVAAPREEGEKKEEEFDLSSLLREFR